MILDELLDLLLLIFKSDLVLRLGVEVVVVLLLSDFEILKQFHVVFEQGGGLDFLQVDVLFHLWVILTAAF